MAMEGTSPQVGPESAPTYFSPQPAGEKPPFRFGLPTTESDAVMRKVSDEDMVPPPLEFQRSRTPRGYHRDMEERAARNGMANNAFAMPAPIAVNAEQPLSQPRNDASLPVSVPPLAERAPTVDECLPSPTSESDVPLCLKNLQPDLVETVLSNSELLEYHADVFFRAYSVASGDVLSAAAVRNFLPDLFKHLAFKEPTSEQILQWFATSDADRDGGLNAKEFRTYFETALKEGKAGVRAQTEDKKSEATRW